MRHSGKFFEFRIMSGKARQTHTLSSRNGNNLKISVNLISSFPPIDFYNADEGETFETARLTKLHIKYSLLLGFYIQTLIHLIASTASQSFYATQQFAETTKFQGLKIFSTKRRGSLYTFTRAPMAHKKHSRVQYHFMHFSIKAIGVHALPSFLIPSSSNDALQHILLGIRILDIFDSNTSALQRLTLSFHFSASTMLKIY